MKKNICYLFLLIPSLLFCEQIRDVNRSLLEIKGGYFFFSNKEMRNIYKNGGGAVEISGSASLFSWSECYALDLYTSVGYLTRSGSSINGEQKTKLWQVPVNIGLRPIFAIAPNCQYYLGVGPTFFYVHQHNDSDYVPRNQGKSGVGFFVNTGFCYKFHSAISFDIFGEYFYGETHFHDKKPFYYSQTIQTGGFVVGAGLGYAF